MEIQGSKWNDVLIDNIGSDFVDGGEGFDKFLVYGNFDSYQFIRNIELDIAGQVDYDKLVQLPPGSKIRFKEVNLSSAENLFKLYELENQNLISQI